MNKQQREAYDLLGKHRQSLTRQQIRTLKGQIVAGDVDGALRGLERMIAKKNEGEYTMSDGINLIMGKDGVFREMPEPYITLYIGSEEEWETLKDDANRGHAMRWISVMDRLPKPNEPVLTFVRCGIDIWMSVACRNDDGFWCLSLTGGRDDWSVTHWMPLPEPPKEDAL